MLVGRRGNASRFALQQISVQVTLNMARIRTMHHVISCVDIEIFIFKAPHILQSRELRVGWREYSGII